MAKSKAKRIEHVKRSQGYVWGAGNRQRILLTIWIQIIKGGWTFFSSSWFLIIHPYGFDYYLRRCGTNICQEFVEFAGVLGARFEVSQDGSHFALQPDDAFCDCYGLARLPIDLLVFWQDGIPAKEQKQANSSESPKHRPQFGSIRVIMRLRSLSVECARLTR
jgi:hypothetical protein